LSRNKTVDELLKRKLVAVALHPKCVSTLTKRSIRWTCGRVMRVSYCQCRLYSQVRYEVATGRDHKKDDRYTAMLLRLFLIVSFNSQLTVLRLSDLYTTMHRTYPSVFHCNCV